MSKVVTGLSQTSDTAVLREAISRAGLSLEHYTVISADDVPDSITGGIIGTDLFTGDQSSAVPGISGPSVGGTTRFFRSEALENRLSDLRIPDSEVENYAEALERGKTIVAYFARPENVDKAVELFKSELQNVRVF